jgi:transcriptional regulator with XRE-family HTH domain
MLASGAMKTSTDRTAVRRYMRDTGNLRVDIAKRMGVAPSTIGRFLNEQRELSERSISSLARITGVSELTFLRCKTARRLHRGSA